MIKLAAGEYLGAYRVQEFLARGGFALIYLANDASGDKVALKVGDVAGGGRYVTRFLDVTSERRPEGISPDETPGEAVFFRKDGARIDFLDAHEIDLLVRGEGELLGAARHQNLVGVRDAFVHEGRSVVVMDYVRGKTLREKIRSLEGIHLNWFLAAVRALATMKEAGTLEYHGDLKPENMIVKPSGKIVLIDPAMREPLGKVVTTTPHYNPLLLTDSKADVMAIGIMIYEILTGTLPFDEVPWEYACKKSGGETVRLSLSYFFSYCPPQMLNPKTPPELERIIYRCITVPPYGLVELRSDLEEFIGKA